MKTFLKYLIAEEITHPNKYTVSLHLHPNEPPVIYLKKKKSQFSESKDDDHIDGALYKSLGKFKPSKLDHDTITKEYHEHLHKHGYYSTAPSHPMVLSPKQYKFKSAFKAKTSKTGRGKHEIIHHDYGSGRFKDYPNPHIGVWSSRAPTHLHKNTGERIHDAAKDGDSVIFHDSRVKHKSSGDNDRWFLHSTDIAKIPKEGMIDHKGKNHGHDIDKWIKSRKPAQSKLRRDVMEFHKKEHGTEKHKKVMDWISKEHPEFHPDKLKHNVSGKIS